MDGDIFRTDPQTGLSIRFIRAWQPEPIAHTIARDLWLLELLRVQARWRAEMTDDDRRFLRRSGIATH